MGGRIFEYDKLLIATGATAQMPRFFGRNLNGVKTVRNLADAHFISANLGRDINIAVVGGGPLSIAMARCATLYGAVVTLILRENHLGFPLIDQKGAKVVEKNLKKIGVKILYRQEVVECFGDNGKLIELRTSENQVLPCTLCIVCTGVAPNLELAYRTGIESDLGIWVNERLQTSAPDIYAAGDVARLRTPPAGREAVSRHWADAAAMGWTAGLNMAGNETVYAPGPFCNIGKLADTPYALYGQYLGTGQGEESVNFKKDGGYQRLVFEKDVLVGAMIIGGNSRYEYLLALIEKKAKVRKSADQLLDEAFDPEKS